MQTIQPRSYNAVINQAIDAAIKQGRDGLAGFCMLQGPTGSGKSSALYRCANDGAVAVLEFLRQQKEGKFPAILVTHRWNILQDIYASTVASCDSKGQPLRVSMLYGQTETISAAILKKPLPLEDNAGKSGFPSYQEAIDQFEDWELFEQRKEKSQLTKNCRAARDLAMSIERRPASTPATLLQRDSDELGKLCGFIEADLLKMMTRLENEIARLQKEDADVAVIDQCKQRLANFRAQPWVRRVLPAIAWRDEQHDLLVMTTHKLLFSFYDGCKKVRLASPDLAGYVIFIDEFDYQADVFQSLLAQAQKIQELPICIALLLEKGSELLQRIEHDERSDVQEVCKLLGKLLTDLNAELSDKNINLAAVNSFVMPLEDFKAGRRFKTQYLFRADHLATRESLFLRKTAQGFAVMQGQSNSAGDIDVGQFLRLMEKYLRNYTSIFSRSAWQDSTATGYLRQLNALLFDSSNDYQVSYYSRVLPEMAHFTLPAAHVPELKTLLDNNILPHTQANLHGFTTWLLKANDDADAMDRQRLQVKRAYMPTTAEGLLVALASRNLVFGLSATAYIERALGHFDVRWVNAALRYVAQARDQQFDYSFLGDSLQERKQEWLEKPIPYLPSLADLQQQQAMIQRLTQDKAQLRRTKLTVKEEGFYAEATGEFEELIRALPIDFFTHEDAFESDAVLEHRQSLLVALLRVLKVAASREGHQGHLVFVNSSRHLRQLLDKCKSILTSAIDWCLDDESFYAGLSASHPMAGFKKVFAPMQLMQRPVFICFLNAENQKKPGFMQAYQAAFDTGRTVVVVAQAASATNGINLDFTVPSSGLSSDLTCLYLLESHHFYFSTAQVDGQTDAMTHAGMQLRNLDKLRRFSQVSKSEHRKYLSPLMAQEPRSISALNTLYKKTEDFCKNLAADVQQQVGRIERVWTSVPEVEIYLEPDIASTLRTFSKLPVYQNNKSLVSELNQRLLDELDNVADSDWESFIGTPAQSGSDVSQWIDDKLIDALRCSRHDAALFKHVEKVWRHLGRAVLQYDLMWEAESLYLPKKPLKDWACVKRPISSNAEQKLWYNPSTWQFFAEAKQGCVLFDMEKLYRPIQQSPAILDWFRHKDYRTSLVPFANEVEERFVLHPLIVQRILQGRLGEEGIRAILEDAGIRTTDQYSSHKMFEEYDFSIVDSLFRVDAKYWSDYSLEHADSSFDTSGGEGSSFSAFADTLKRVRAVEGAHIRLLVINLVTERTGESLVGFSIDGEHVAAECADIVFLAGCLNSQDFAVTNGFEHLVSLVKQVDSHE